MLNAAAYSAAQCLKVIFVEGGPPRGACTVEEYIKSNAALSESFINLMATVAHLPAPVDIGGEIQHPDQDCSYEEPRFAARLSAARIFKENFAIISRDDRMLHDVSSWYGSTVREHWIQRRLRLGRPRFIPGKSFFYGGIANYYHHMIESVPRVKILRDAGMDLQEFDHIVMYSPTAKFEREVVEHFKIRPDSILDLAQLRHAEFQELTVVSSIWKGGSWVIDFLKGEFGIAEGLQTKRIYIPRRDTAYRRVVNEEQIIPILRSAGFEDVRLDDMSIREQARIFENASIVVSVHGAAMANIAFCRPGTPILELRRSAHVGGNWFWRLAGLAKLPYFVLHCPLGGEPDPRGTNYESITADPVEFKRLLDSALALIQRS